MLNRVLTVLFLLVVLGAGAFYLLTIPQPLDAATLPDATAGDAAAGERIFWAGGCASCHADPDAENEELPRLGGGEPLETEFGTFHGPNISPHPTDGIGSWTLPEFANAVQRGIGRDGEHLYPAFPYTSYVKMDAGDVADLWTFMRTLPPVEGAAPANDLAFPFNIRRGIGLWKLAFLGDGDPIVNLPQDAPETVHRGRYLVEGPGHCGQCHTPRSLAGAGGLQLAAWLSGAPNPEGEGQVPNITPSDDGLGSWSAGDIAYYLESGFTPDFDTVGGPMVAVQENMARLPAADREAIAAYLKAIPPVADAGEAQ